MNNNMGQKLFGKDYWLIDKTRQWQLVFKTTE